MAKKNKSKKEKQARLIRAKPKKAASLAKKPKSVKQAMPKKDDINRDTTLEKVMQIPGAQAILFENHVPCLSCPMGAYEMPMLKLGMVCDMYGLEYDKIVKELKRLKEIGFEKWQEEKQKVDKSKAQDSQTEQ